MDWQRLIPRYWMQNYPSDKEWDKILNHLMDTCEPEFDHMTVRFGPIEVWVSNYPYAFGYPYRHKQEYLPYVRTRKRLKKIVDAGKWDELKKLVDTRHNT